MTSTNTMVLKAGPRLKVVARLSTYRAKLSRQEEQVSRVALQCSAEQCSIVQCMYIRLPFQFSDCVQLAS
jgi:hypothetical protein